MTQKLPRATEEGASVVSVTEALAVAAKAGRPDVSQYGIVAIDPGEHHVGIAIGYGLGVSMKDDELVMSLETTPARALPALWYAIQCGWIDCLVVETFRLQPDKAMAQSGSEMNTSQMIGAIKLMLQLNESNGERMNLPALFWQAPSIKPTTKAVLKSMNILPTSVGSDHARDAELHWWHLLLSRRELLPGRRLAPWPVRNDYGVFRE